jgi:hypothetical protein
MRGSMIDFGLSIVLVPRRDQPLRFWSIQLPSGICYLVFELIDDRCVAGRGYDRCASRASITSSKSSTAAIACHSSSR